jgi:hypothetical protein
MDYAYGIPLAIANLSPSLSPMQRLLNAISSFASFMRRDFSCLAKRAIGARPIRTPPA